MIKCQNIFKVFDKPITDEATRMSFCEELALDVDSVLDNIVDPVLAGLGHLNII